MTEEDFEILPVETPDAGTYRAIVSDAERVVLDMKEGPTEFLRLTFTVPIAGTEEPWITDAIAATKDSKGLNAYGNPRMKLTRWVKAILGGLPPLNRDSLVGAECLIVLDLNANGMMSVADVIPKAKGS